MNINNNKNKVWISGISYPYDGWTLTGIWSSYELAEKCATTPISGHSWILDEDRENIWNAICDFNNHDSDMVSFVKECNLDEINTQHQINLDYESTYRAYMLEQYGLKDASNQDLIGDSA